nr:hypothetical protein Itr_chr07CG03710 [Ipomoea trifida]
MEQKQNFMEARKHLLLEVYLTESRREAANSDLATAPTN